MNAAAIFALIAKGLTVVEALLAAGQQAAPAIEALTALAKGGESGTVTDEQLAQTEALLDQLISDFNIELPPAG